MSPDLLTAIIGALGGIVAAAIAVLPQLRKTNARIDTLFFYTMSGPMYDNLKKLADGNFMEYEMSDGLKRELYHLRDTGFIEITDRSQRSIRKIPSRGDNLQQYVRVTEVGRKFVDTRRKLDRQGV
jgi:DNA-binding PadR family transcriptional regulator